MSPEQASAQSRRLSAAADVYSLGAILYEMLTGRPPFQASRTLDVLLQVIERDPMPPRKLSPAISPDLETICLKCLDKRPSHRYATASALADDLERWVEGRPIRARPVGRVERAWLWCRRKPVVAGLLAAAAGLLVVVGVLSVLNYQRARLNDSLNTVNQLTKAAEDKAQADARREREKQRKEAYNSDLRQAGQAWNANDLARVRQLLERQCPAEGESDLRGWEWHLLDADTRGYLATVATFGAQAINGSNGVAYFSWSPNSQRLAWGAGLDLQLWDPATPKGTGPLHVQGPIRRWDAATGKETGPVHVSGPMHIPVNRLDPGDWSPDGRRLATIQERSVTIWDTTSCQPLHRIPAGGSTVSTVWSPDGRQLVTWVPVHFWDAETGTSLAVLPDTDKTTAVAFSPDGRRLATLDFNRLHVWDVTERKESFAPIASTNGGWSSVTWSPDGKRLAVLDGDPGFSYHKYTFLDAVGGKILGVGSRWKGVPGYAVWTPDAERLAVFLLSLAPPSNNPNCPGYSTAYAWEVTTGKGLFTLPAAPYELVTWSADGRRLLTSLSGASAPEAWEPSSGVAVSPTPVDLERLARFGEQLPFQSGPIGEGARRRSPDRRRLAELRHGSLQVWDMTQGKRELPQFRMAMPQYPGAPGQPGPVPIVPPQHPGAPGQPSDYASPDGQLLVNSAEGIVRNARTGDPVHLLGGGSRSIDHADWSPDGRWLATTTSSWIAGGRDVPILRVCDATAGRQVIEWPDVNQYAWSADGHYLASVAQGRIHVWEPARGQESQTLLGEASVSQPTLLLWSPDGRRLLAQDFVNAQTRQPTRPQVWDVATAHVVRSLNQTMTAWPSFPAGTNISWGKDSRSLKAECGGAIAWTWDLSEDRPKPYPAEVPEAVQKLPAARSRSPDGLKWAAIDSGLQQVQIWSSDRGLRGYRIPDGGNPGLLWGPDSRYLLVGRGYQAADKQFEVELRIVDTQGDTEPVTIAVTTKPPPAPPPRAGPAPPPPPASPGTEPVTIAVATMRAGWSPRGDRVAGFDGEGVKVWETTTGRLIFTGPLTGKLYWSPDERFLLGSTPQCQGSSCWDLNTAKEVFTAPGIDLAESAGLPGIGLGRVLWSSDGRHVTLQDRQSGTTSCWDLAAGKEILRLHGRQVELAPGGDRLLSCGSQDGTAHVWDLASGRPVLTLGGPPPTWGSGAFKGACWNPDGRWLAAVRGTATLLWDVRADKEYPEQDDAIPPIAQAAWSPDGRQLALQGYDGPVRLWEMAGARVVQTLPAQPEPRFRAFPLPTVLLRWTSDGGRVIAGSGFSVRAWDTTTGKPAGEVSSALERPDERWATAVGSSPDGECLGVLRAFGALRNLQLSLPPVSWSSLRSELVLWDVATGQARQIVAGSGADSCLRFAWAPDGKHVAAASGVGRVHVWDRSTGKETQVLTVRARQDPDHARLDGMPPPFWVGAPMGTGWRLA
jgi:WD40 repeat protein